MDVDQLANNKRTNRWQTIKLIVGMMLILAFIGYLISGWYGGLTAIPIALFIVIFGEKVSSMVVLRMFHAERIDPSDIPEVYELHTELCERAELGYVPPLYYIPSRMMNAFATGIGEQSVVAITDGLLRHLNERELAGVLAHEISHIRHKDIKILSMADSFSQFASTASRFGIFFGILGLLSGYWSEAWKLVLLVLAPILTTLLQLALSRSREFNADMGASELTGDPEGLAMALEKLERMHSKGWLRKILFPGNHQPDSNALRTHPPTDERVDRLMKLIPQYESKPSLFRKPSRRIPSVSNFERVRRPPGWHWLTGFWY